MKLFGENGRELREDENQFIHESIACTINAMIEVMNLPAEMLCTADPDAIFNKLLELSDDKESWRTPAAQVAWLEDVINRICDDEMAERVLKLTSQKFDAYMKTPVPA